MSDNKADEKLAALVERLQPMTVEVLSGYLRDKNMRDRLVLSIDDPEKGRAVVSKVVILYWAGGARRFTAENA